MQRIDVTDGLDSTLVMLGHRLRVVTVLREYAADVPMIDAYAGELNQVWTNVIDNALDAMDGSGTLRVATRLDADHVVIEIGDTGAGMSSEVAARAFEPFYTTKDVGKEPVLGWTLHAASSSSATVGRSRSTLSRGRLLCGYAFRFRNADGY